MMGDSLWEKKKRESRLKYSTRKGEMTHIIILNRRKKEKKDVKKKKKYF